MKAILLILVIAAIDLKAQFVASTLKVDGLTCSMCSKSVHNALNGLNFVDSIIPNLETTSFKIYFKKDQKVLIYEIKNKVEGAGFSIGELKVDYLFTNVNANNGSFFSHDDCDYQFIAMEPRLLNGVVTFKILEKGFVSKKEYKSNSKQPNFRCVYKPGAENCKSTIANNGHIIHITL